MSSKIERDIIDVELFLGYLIVNRNYNEDPIIKKITDNVKTIVSESLERFIETEDNTLITQNAFLIESLSVDGQYGSNDHIMVTFEYAMIITYRDKIYNFELSVDGKYYRC